MIDIGVSTSCFYPLYTEEALRFLAVSGVKTVEIFINALSELEPEFIGELRQLKDEYGIRVSSIHPTMSLAESFMLFSAYDRRYNEGIEQFKRYAQVAGILGADYIILHGGKPNGVLDDYGYCERFAKIAGAVRQNGAELLQENVVSFRAGDLQMLKYMAETLGDEVGFCIDVKQSIRGGYTALEAIDAVGKRLKHLHISDNRPERDCLLPLDGGFDFNALFKKAKSVGFDGSAIIEVYNSAYNDYREIICAYNKLKQQVGGAL